MAIFAALLILIGACVVLTKSVDFVVKTAVILARRLRINEFCIGFFILGLVTSTPELFVGINSAITNTPQLSLGNLIGATIVLLTLIVGINAVISGEVHFIHGFTRKDMWLTSFIIMAPAFLLVDGVLSRIDGIFLIVIYALFYILLGQQQLISGQLREELSVHTAQTTISLFQLLVGAVGLFVGAKIGVESAVYLATQLHIPLLVIGLLFISIGTNLPELTILFTTIRKRHKQVGIGDFLGSAVANTPILGLVAILQPIAIDAPVKIFFSLGMLLLTLIVFNAFFSLDKRINRMEGVVLVALYGFFIFAELLVKPGL